MIIYVIPEAAEDYSEVQDYLETIRWDYVAVPGIAESEVTSFATWIKAPKGY